MGILEEILDKLILIERHLAQGNAPGSAGNAQGSVGNGQTPAMSVGAYVAAAQPAQLQVPSNITADQITALIQPHIGNEQTKAALGAAMRGMGINALPEAQPHQFAALYQAFQEVIHRHAAAPQPPVAATSII